MIHGDAKKGDVAVEYSLWVSMIQRCHNPRSSSYDRYGKKGVTVCTAWRHSYRRFLADVGRRPNDDLSLERIDGRKGYYPSNVKWATRTEQARNKSNSRTITANGVSKLLCEWSDLTGISRPVIFYRLKRGWSPERAVSVKPWPNRKVKQRGTRQG